MKKAVCKKGRKTTKETGKTSNTGRKAETNNSEQYQGD